MARRLAGEFEQQTFVDIIEECSQDAGAVIQVPQHTLSTLKAEHPEITNAALRQDNAGCYHGVAMLSACRLLGSTTGIRVKRVDLSDPQECKGPCDRKAATIKSHVQRYISEGHDVVTAHDFKEAILSYGGISGVRVVLMSDAADRPQQEVTGRWDGISTFNNFLYEESCITVWKAYYIGQGKTISWFLVL